MYNRCAEGLRPLNLQPAPDRVWQEALGELAQAGMLRRLIEVVTAEGPGDPLAEAIEQVMAAEPLVNMRVVTSDVLVVDRQPLRDRLDQLGPDGNPAKVVLVRGQPKCGKTHGRYLFELAAHDQGADALYLSFGMVSDVEEAVLWLFSSLGASDEDIPPGDSTQNAWYLKVSMALLRWVSARGIPAWIAVDDLGPGPDGTPLMVAEFVAYPDAARFAPRHRIGEPFRYRDHHDHIPIDRVTEARNPEDWAAALGVAPARLLELNPGGDPATMVLPDPDFAPLVAAYLSARIATSGLDRADRTRLTAALIPIAAADATALDLVLGRWICALGLGFEGLPALLGPLSRRSTVEPAGGGQAGVA